MLRSSSLNVCKLLTALILFGTATYATGCRDTGSSTVPAPTPKADDSDSPAGTLETADVIDSAALGASSTLPDSAEVQRILDESWQAYREQFIQDDGRVIDFEAGDRTVSEGQAYAMIRAVLVDDPATFAKTLNWAEDNLRRKQDDQAIDQLWGWIWGQQADEQWGLVDANFASDADIDAAFALILAARRWQRPDYLELAEVKLVDIWEHSTFLVKGTRYLMPGPEIAFRDSTYLYLNPSYLAPYAFRLFAQVDSERDWMALVDSSYEVLENSAALSVIGLPSDWVALNLVSGEFEPIPASGDFQNQYGFDAYRVWWRVAWDAVLFDAPVAQTYLNEHLPVLEARWEAEQAIPAEFDLQGQPLVDYGVVPHYAAIYAALQHTDEAIAGSIYHQQIAPEYQAGIWGDSTAYYSQNLVWLGIYPPAQIKPLL